ncbi:MAG TPA: hypothetical protein VJO72_01480 [Candidatus Dormibacteraeota bacterium]|nr:hypothetical protein [Candidatus Dormibacteraeota bacterium]
MSSTPPRSGFEPDIELNAAKIRLEAQQEILLTCGKSTIRITPGDIQILSPTDRLNC